MEVQNVYSHPDVPGLAIWQSPNGLTIKNGKQGHPVVLNCPKDNYEVQAMVAEAFFKGFLYAS